MKNLFRMKRQSFTIGTTLLFLSGVCFAADVPRTTLTKSCKPLVNTKLEIKDPPFTGYSERVHKRLTRAQERLAEDKYDEGIEMLKSLLESARSDYVKATVNIQLAYAYAQSGKEDQSYPFFKAALDLGENTLPNRQVQSLRENVASFMFSNGNKKGAIKLMEDWMKKSNVEKARPYYYLAAMYADEDINKMKSAVCPAFLATKTEAKAKDSYFSLLLAIHFQLGDIKGSAAILRKMIEYFPEKKTYWRQLSQIYMQLDQTKESLAIMEMFYLQNKFDKDVDYKMLSQLFGFEQIPYRAAQVLEEGINKGLVTADDKNWRSVARYYHASNHLDKAITAYGETAKYAEDGNDFFKQAELYSDSEKWKLAVQAFDKALQKGKLDDIGRAYLRKGVALVNNGSCSSGLKALEQASKYKKHSSAASGWTTYAQDRMRENKC